MSDYNYYNKDSDNSWLAKVIMLFAILCIIIGASKSCSRSEANMVYISEGYCYHEETKIIYIESFVGRYADRTSYAVYYDENGKINKYDLETGNWIPVD